jgi:hypothetical protein
MSEPEFAGQLRRACAVDPFFYINAFCWTVDPKRPHKRKKVPFVTYQYQDDALDVLLDSLDDAFDVQVEKSRQMGASWLLTVLIQWCWRFRRGQNFLLLSRSDEYVDKSDEPKSLFWKALTLATPVVTPTGMVPIGELVVNDLVIGSDGRGHAVTNIIDHDERPVYRVTFADGTSVRCCGDHEWTVTDVATRHDAWLKEKEEAGTVVKNTADMYADFRRVYEGAARQKVLNVFRIPLGQPVQWDRAEELPIPPYTLGALLGDGCFSKPAIEICGIDNEIQDRVQAELTPGVTLTKTGKCSYILNTGNTGSIADSLKSLGLRGCRSWEKFIPQQYLFADAGSRLALLRGLMDTDGWAYKYQSQDGPQSTLSFETTSRQLAEDMTFLIRSLGGYVNAINSYPRWFSYKGERRQGRAAYRFTFTIGENPFHLKRKVALYSGRYRRWKTIVNIEPCGIEPVRCIAIDSPDHLFLVDGFNLTHNCDFIHRNLPSWLMPVGWDSGKHRKVKRIVNPENQNAITGEATTEDSGRGGTYTAVLHDEFAACDVGTGILKSTRACTGTRWFNSTPKGTGNAHYRIVQLSRQNPKQVRPLRFHWSQHPEFGKGLYRINKDGKIARVDKDYPLAADYFESNTDLIGSIKRRGFWDEFPLRSPWFDTQCGRATTKAEIAQELEIDYQGAGYQFFEQSDIQELIRLYCCPPLVVGDLDYDLETLEPMGFRQQGQGRLELWCELPHGTPPLGRPYVIGVDAAAGTGASNSVASIWDAKTAEKVGEYVDPTIKPERFARFVIALAKWFDEAYVIWETNGSGRAFGDAVIEWGYGRFYSRAKNDDTGETGVKAGWAPTRDNKYQLLSQYRGSLTDRTAFNRSQQAMQETLEYVFLGNNWVEHAGLADVEDPSGARDQHGDRVTADALACKVMDDQPKTTLQVHRALSPMSMAGRREMARRLGSADGNPFVFN